MCESPQDILALLADQLHHGGSISPGGTTAADNSRPPLPVPLLLPGCRAQLLCCLHVRRLVLLLHGRGWALRHVLACPSVTLLDVPVLARPVGWQGRPADSGEAPFQINARINRVSAM